jgi:hypothetical protein
VAVSLVPVALLSRQLARGEPAPVAPTPADARAEELLG